MSAWYAGLLLGAVAAVELLGAATLLGGIASAVLHGHWRTWRAGAWLMIGICGLPAMVLTFLYIIGFAIALVVFWVSAFCAPWPRLAHAFAASLVVASTIAFGSSIPSNGLEDLGVIVLLGASAPCGLLVIAKLGRTFGGDTIWRSRLATGAAASA